jgi:hypothetical protein
MNPSNRLTEIDVRNFKRVRRAHLMLDGNTLVITGDNEEGKSSFLDGIAALFGGADKAPKTPVRKGAKEAIVIGRLTTKTGQKLKATLTFGLPNSRRIVVVDDESGKPLSSPQALLNAFWDETSFDPSLFLASEEKDQLAMLRKLAGLDFTASDAEHARIFAERTAVNREVERLRGALSSQVAYPNAPAEEVTSASILTQIDAADRHNKECDQLDAVVNTRTEDLASAKEDVASIEKNIASLKQQLADAEKRLKEDQQILQGAQKSLDDGIAARDAKKRIDTTPLRGQLSEAESTNAKVRSNAARAKTAAELKAKTAEAEKMTQRLEAIAEAKEEKIRSAKFPVEGLSLTETGVMFEGLPLEQASDSRKIAIGVEMAAAMNPDKPLMLVRHGNLFTGKNFAILEDIAAKRNLTVIVEIAGEKRADSRLHFQDGIGDDGSGITSESEPTAESVPESAAPAEAHKPAQKTTQQPDLLDLPPS